jgi:hypothetical protein
VTNFPNSTVRTFASSKGFVDHPDWPPVQQSGQLVGTVWTALTVATLADTRIDEGEGGAGGKQLRFLRIERGKGQ